MSQMVFCSKTGHILNFLYMALHT